MSSMVVERDVFVGEGELVSRMREVDLELHRAKPVDAGDRAGAVRWAATLHWRPR